MRLAVLPFSDQSNGSIEQAAADGIANDVIHRFERSETVLVFAHNSTFTFRRVTDERASLNALKDQLNADDALLGELFRTRDLVRIAVWLPSVETGKAVWTSVFTKSDDRLSEMPDLIASGALKVLGLPDGGPSTMSSLDAYELYLLGLNAYQTQRSVEGLRRAGDDFQHAIDRDPTCARAFMQKAVDLYPGNAEAQFGLGNGYAFDAQPREAVKRFAVALQLDPLNYVIHSRWGQDTTFLGDFEAACVHFARAATLVPKYPWRFLGPGLADYARGHLDDAIVNDRLQFEQDPRRPDA